MATQTWPAGLPQIPITNGFNETPTPSTLRSKMDVGPVKTRNRSTKDTRDMTAKFFMTKAQVEILDIFYVTTLIGGSLEFDFTHPRTLNNIELKFKKPPTYTTQGGDLWLANCQFEEN